MRKRFLTTVSVAAGMLGLHGCSRTRLAPRSMTEAEQQWQTFIERSYCAWKPPYLSPVVPVPPDPAAPPASAVVAPAPRAGVSSALPVPAAGDDIELVPVDGNKIQPRAAMQTYTVQPGDTLRTVALKFYGVPRGWRRILDCNRALISAPDRLRPGQVLKIPPDARN